MSFTNLDTVTLYLNREELTLLESQQVEMLIKQVDGIISNYCGWDMLASERVKRLNGNGTADLDLGAYPLNSLTHVKYNDGTGWVDVTTDCDLIASEGIISLFSDSASITTFPAGTRNVEVSANLGYSAEAMPWELTYAASMLVITLFNRITTENIGVNKERFEQDEVEYSSVDIPPGVAKVLDRYRKLWVF